MNALRKHARLIVEGTLGILLILFSLPAIGRALTAFRPKILFSLFLFVLALVIVRDRNTFSQLLARLRSRHNGQ